MTGDVIKGRRGLNCSPMFGFMWPRAREELVSGGERAHDESAARGVFALNNSLSYDILEIHSNSMIVPPPC